MSVRLNEHKAKPISLLKMYIALKEAEESAYWILLLRESGFLTDKEFDSIGLDCEELIKILISMTKTTAPRKDLK